MSSKKKHSSDNTIALNKKARHHFSIEETLEAGIVLQGWEVKCLRAGRIQIVESHITLRNDEAWLFNAHIPPLPSTSTHTEPDPMRRRKLLLKRREINRLIGLVERKGYALVPLSMYWKQQHAKISLGIARGKKQHDKRAASKARDWERQKQQLLR